MDADRKIAWSLAFTAVWIVGVTVWIVFKSRWETFVSRWRASDRGDEVSGAPAVDPPLEFPSGEAIFAVLAAVASAVEALHELPTEAWVT